MKRALLPVALAALLPAEAFAQSVSPLERSAGACSSCNPDGWSVLATSPDVIVGDGPWPGGTYTMADITGGPVQGSNMALFLSSTSGVRESITTTITGLTSGTAYDLTVSYQSATLTNYSGISYENGSFSVVIGSTATLFATTPGDAWAVATVPFTATGPSQVISLTIGSVGTGSYGGAVVADGISVAKSGGSYLYYRDADGDGYGDSAVTTSVSSATAPSGYTTNSADCDDTSAAVYPGATEIPYDAIDQDCDGEDLTDVDGDGYDAEIVGGTDCDDSDATVHPGATQGADGVDDDCDGTVDETTDWHDDDGDGFAEAGGDCDDGDATASPAAVETCDGVDDDCDGLVDDGTDCYDDDGDGLTEAEGDCNDNEEMISPAASEDLSNGVDDDCDGVVDSGAFDEDGDGYLVEGDDCAEGDASIHPGAVEIVDGVDQDCDGVIDEGTSAYDDDGDGFSEADGDCDDTSASTHPDAGEDSTNGRDDDCDGTLDEDGAATDDDGDGFSEEQGDCDDADAGVSPGAEEAENGADDDCDGEVDEDFIDVDRDGFTTEEGDCNDLDGFATPDKHETCDGIDNNCDGTIDEGVCEDDAGEVPPTEKKCGCASPGSASGGLLPLIALLLYRRRSPRP